MKAGDWIKRLDAEDAAHKDYRNRADQVVERYEDETKRDDSKFNILWSNVEVLHGAVFAKTPVPDVRRRYLDRDPNGKKAAELTERALSYCIDTYDFDATIDAAVDDYLLAGIGIVRLHWKPFFEEKPGPNQYLSQQEIGVDEYGLPKIGLFNGDDQIEDYQTDDEGYAYIPGEPVEDVVYEEATSEPINWKRFRWQPADRWENVDWVAIEHYPTKEDIHDHQNEEGEYSWRDYEDEIPLTYTEKGTKADPDADEQGRALIYEIFDKKNRKVIFIADGLNTIIEEQDDYLNLEGFYPFPKPLFGTTKNGKLIPIPDFTFYQDQAAELDRITDRINKLVEQLKYRGVYDASFDSLRNIEQSEDGEFVPVDDFQALLQQGGQGDLKKVMATVPIDQLIIALRELYVNREQVKQTIYEITGIADIMRGSSKASETLGAQQLKTQFGSMRLTSRQKRVAKFIRNILRMKAEIMVENFKPKTLEMMTGQEMTQEIYDILTNDLMRSYRIDIETDSTIIEDAAQEKQSRIDLVTAITGFIEKTGPMVQAGLLPANVASELMGFAVRGFKVGRTLEDTLDEMASSDDDPRMKSLQQKFQQAQQQMQQQMQQQVKQIQQQAGKEIQGLQKQLFDKEKQLAITKSTDQAKMFQAKQKGDIDIATKQYQTELQIMLEAFKEQIRNQQAFPEERLGEVASQLADAITRVAEETDARTAALQDKIIQIDEFQKRPVKVIRDKRGKVVGATRD